MARLFRFKFQAAYSYPYSVRRAVLVLDRERDCRLLRGFIGSSTSTSTSTPRSLET